MQSIARPASPRPESGSDACRHSREPFDALFAVINERPDIGPGAKLLYGKLVTMHRIGASWTQAELGELLGTCKQNVWRWTAELVGAGLLLVERVGQGRPNRYVLLGVDRDDLDGRPPAIRMAGSGSLDGRPPATLTARSSRKKEHEKMMIQPEQRDYLETRYGRLVPRGT